MERIRLAIAEDNEIIRNILLENFAEFDTLEVVVATENGKLLLDALSENTIDVVLLDVNMPIMDGYETIIRLQSLFPSVKVIMFSSVTRIVAINYFINMGAYKFLAKNSKPEDIMSAILEVHLDNTDYNLSPAWLS